MDSIELMKDEHKNIKRGLNILRSMSIALLNGKHDSFNDYYEDFMKMIDFIRNYADRHHHNKEEAVLFKIMSEDLGKDTVKAPLSGMYIEHDFGRLFIKNLEEALSRVKSGDNDSKVDVIANAIAYTDLLKRHIEKEDSVIYSFADRALSSSAKGLLESECSKVELSAEKNGFQESYMKVLDALEEKWTLIGGK